MSRECECDFDSHFDLDFESVFDRNYDTLTPLCLPYDHFVV